MTGSPRASRPTVPYALTRLGVVMTPEPGNPLEAEGVLNPASGRDSGRRLYLLPRLVAAGNVSRVGLAEVVLEDGVPVGVERRGRGARARRGLGARRRQRRRRGPADHLDRRARLHVMTYVAFGPLGPRLGARRLDDLRHWRRLGPVQFAYEPRLDTDLNLFPNKDAVFFPEPVPGPDGEPAYAMLHRPMWDLGWIRQGDVGTCRPGSPTTGPASGSPTCRSSVVEADIRALTRPAGPPLRGAARVPVRGS